MRRSTVAAWYGMAAAFVRAEEFILGPDRTWNPINPEQKRWTTEVFPLARAKLGAVPETDAAASWKAEDVNEFLRERGFDDISLQPFAPDTFGIAGVMRVRVAWVEPGTRTTIVDADGTTYPGARIEARWSDARGCANVEFLRSPGHPHPIAMLRTTTGDVVYLTKFARVLDPLDLTAAAQAILLGAEPAEGFGAIRFPMVDLDVCPDMNWLVGLWTTLDGGQRATVAGAWLQCRLKLNHVGAVAEDGFAAAITLESCGPTYPDLVIDDDFLCVLRRPGLGTPLQCAIVRRGAWQDPGDDLDG